MSSPPVHATSGDRYQARPFNPRAALRDVAGFFAAGLATSGLYAGTGIGFPCPLRAVTGWQCPFCGGTRLGSALLHLQVGQAFADNPVVFVGLLVLALLAVFWSVEILGGPRVRPPAAVGERLSRVHPTTWLVIVVALGVVDTLLRNLR